MTSTTTRIVVTALAVLALAAPAAFAEPYPGSENGRPAGTSQYQDLRNADNRAPRYVAPLQSPAPVVPAAPKPAAASTNGGGISPFAIIIPGVVLIAMLGAGVAYARTSRPTRGSVA